jgi:hypothetical protein
MLTALFFFFVIGKGLRAQPLPVKVGKETMVGQTVSALTPIDASRKHRAKSFQNLRRLAQVTSMAINERKNTTPPSHPPVARRRSTRPAKSSIARSEDSPVSF